MSESKHNWFLGSMNDGLFIINTVPRPSATDSPPQEHADGPTVVLNVTDLQTRNAQAVCDAHNAEVPTLSAQVVELKAENERLLKNAASDSKLLSSYHAIVTKLGASPSTSDLYAFRDYKPGTWAHVNTVDEMQEFYLSRLQAIRLAAHEHGYAIGVHGSQRRDFDLMAMQWREGASDKDTLAHAIAEAACGISRDGPYQWEQKPLGRVATSFPICWTEWSDMISAGHIDLSVIDDAALGSDANG